MCVLGACVILRERQERGREEEGGREKRGGKGLNPISSGHVGLRSKTIALSEIDGLIMKSSIKASYSGDVQF
jgi:hypothetical protein